MLLITLLFACGQPRATSCSSAEGHAFSLDERCMALPTWSHGEVDPEFATTFELAAGEFPDWDAIDAALATGPVRVAFAPGEWERRIDIARGDDSENLLLLEGRAPGSEARAVVPGIHTGFDDVENSYITVRGFEVTGSRDKGVYWRAGSHVILEDLVVHDNQGSPAINLDYSNRSGFRSERFVVRNSHVYDQKGECIYIGGSEGEDEPSHARIELVNNLVHGCRGPDSKTDGINVKDRINEVWVHRNVVYDTDWGIEVASPGAYTQNLVLRSRREGFQVADGFAPIGGMFFQDNVVIDPGHDGIHVSAYTGAAGSIFAERMNVFGAREAGVKVSGEFPVQVSLADVVLGGNEVGFDGFGEGSATIDTCSLGGNGIDADRNLEGLDADCTSFEPPDVSNPAGPDGSFFTADDPWLLDGMGAQLQLEE